MLPCARANLRRSVSDVYNRPLKSSLHPAYRQFHHLSQRTCTSEIRSSGLVPIVIEQTGRGERSYDIFSRLLRERVVMLHGPIHDSDSALIVSQLLFLEAEDSSKPIHLYINSPGGSVTAGMAIYDTYVSSSIHTYCIGQACSMGSLLLVAGEKGKRHCLPHASIMIHQPSGGASGQASDIAIHAKEILRVREVLTRVYQHHCQRPNELETEALQRFETALERDYFMTAQEALDFGIVDSILEKRPRSDSGVTS
ncbi:hypothetical protein PUNSTDRAFT_48303 [Punctularia strigosozonata HHB-11173 SS5]|uniref:uncharacterized protein n=1 Tax=Punctularia strigosozonata (strain HHB-11173) TaxID=741275 RepID=UPI0004417EAA|nr:uncharacterized protein PUNSTDRAFT_48303 [Punctularia strigosozonata HHB-11173 SS5]EIN13250.1 hypothetical protein PUNSTDRAFT_48303 [Punctularia strigosozonata HHB-11173 SS5]